MNSRIFSVVPILCSLISSSIASAELADNLWFSVVNAPAGWTHTSGPGQALEINNGGIAGTARIAMNITSKSGAMAEWGIRLNGDAVDFSNGTLTGTNYNQMAGSGPTGGRTFSVGYGSSTATGSTGAVYQFDVTATAAGGLVTGDFASNTFTSAGFYWYGFVGPNPISYGCTGACYIPLGPDVTPGWGSLPVVLIHGVPEPTTLALIGIGIFAVIRRKR